MLRGRAIAGVAGSGAALLTLPTTNLLAAWDARQGVTDVGAGKVSSWIDYHGNYDAAQGTSIDQPIIVTGALGGQDAIRFRAAFTERLVVASMANASTAQTFYTVVATTEPAATQTIFNVETGQLTLQNRVASVTLSDGAVRTVAAETLNGTHLSCLVCDGVGTATHYRNGVADSAGAVYTPRVIGGRFAIGGVVASTIGAFDGDIAALFVYTAAHDASARAAVEAYVLQEWGV